MKQRVPDRVLLASGECGGRRLPKRPARPTWPMDDRLPGHYQGTRHLMSWEKPANSGSPGSSRYGNAIIQLESQVEKFKGKWHKPEKFPTIVGNLLNDDYQFWIGTNQPMSVFSKCRACYTVHYTIGARRAHMDEHRHAKLLQLAFRFLEEKKVCVVCGTKQGLGKKWGVPLCGDGCQRAWMFGDKINTAVIAAIQKVKDAQISY